jgi:putative aldouronate transport system permease protein
MAEYISKGSLLTKTLVAQEKKKARSAKFRRFLPFYILALPAIVQYIIFAYLPMIGISIAFFEYGPLGIKKFIGLANFIELFASKTFYRALGNTLVISMVNIVFQVSSSLILALLLNEVTFKKYKRFVQTIVYLPHFLSWVMVASIFTLFLHPETGIVNNLIVAMGGKPISFLADNVWWRIVYWLILTWRDAGWGTVVLLAALSNLDPNLYEAAAIDGASRLKQVWYITLPGISTVIIIVLIMYLSRVLNVFESVFVLHVPIIYDVSDVLGTYIYRKGFAGSDYDYATAVGLFKSLISLILVLGTNMINKRIKGESIF